MVRSTIVDSEGDIVLIMEYAGRSRLDRKIMRSIEIAVSDTSLPYFGYALPLTVTIQTDVSRVNLYVDHVVYHDGAYCNIFRMPVTFKLDCISSRHMWNKGR